MVPLVTRAQWGARSPLRPLATVSWSRRLGVCVHYTASSRDASPRTLQEYAQDTLGYADMHYNLLVDYRGVAYEGRGWDVVAAHSEGENTTHVGISFIGRDTDVTPAAEATIAALIQDADTLAGRKLPELKGHQEMPGAQTACPGPRLLALVRRLREGGDDMSAEAEEHIKWMAYRVEAHNHMFDVIREGPEKGEPVPLVLELKALKAKVEAIDGEAIAERVAELLAARLQS